MSRHVGGKNMGALTITILDMVSGKQMESMAACSLIMARARRLNCDVVRLLRSRMQKHSKLRILKNIKILVGEREKREGANLIFSGLSPKNTVRTV